METFYLIMILFLAFLAASDLIIGVSNDAVNFLNSAVGAKVASLRFILFVASVGIVVGATYSSGMMEVARNGVFHPQMFSFTEIMIIFLAVMMTDVIILDLFNNYGLPTSTTVSIVFELLGGAVAVAAYKLMQSDISVMEVGNFINSEKTLVIITGILVSVAIAFTVGTVIQYLIRLLFTFNYKKTYRYYGAIFGALSITAILYFLVMKGAAGASFMKPEYILWINEHTLSILFWSLVGFTVIFQVLILLFNTNILPLVILTGTFSLAFAFAGNDLVNFIGAPMAGYESWKVYSANPSSPDTLMMDGLNSNLAAPTTYLLIAGLIMVAALWFSKKARHVINTSLKLSSKNQDDKEQFDSNPIARGIVRIGLAFGAFMNRVIPEPITEFLAKRFAPSTEKHDDDAPSFDQIRAAVNLVVSSVLIASATSLKLPLSTTYVTFMVAMGSSLSDGAWSRENAVYRVSGVVTIIGGWFFTAFSAFTAALIVGLLFCYGGKVMIIVFSILTLLILVKSYFSFNKKLKKEEKSKEVDFLALNEISVNRLFEGSDKLVQDFILFMHTNYDILLSGLISEDRKIVKKSVKDIEDYRAKIIDLKKGMYKAASRLREDALESGHFYVRILDTLKELTYCMSFIGNPVYNHLNNNHSPLLEEQVNDLNELKGVLNELYEQSESLLVNHDYDKLQIITQQKDRALSLIEELQRKHLKRIKHSEISTRNSMLYLGILNENKDLILHSHSLLKSNRKFYKLILRN